MYRGWPAKGIRTDWSHLGPGREHTTQVVYDLSGTGTPSVPKVGANTDPHSIVLVVDFFFLKKKKKNNEVNRGIC